MFKAMKLAMQYSHVLPVAIELIQEIEKSIRDDGSISQAERSKLMSKFWKLVKAIQDPVKAKAAQAQIAQHTHDYDMSVGHGERFLRTTLGLHIG